MILLLSDLHLPSTPSPLREGFRRLLQGPARQVQAVYILGDLFEYWVGDDLGLDDYAEEAAALRTLTASGVPVYFMGGNRDYLVGKRFAQATGVQLLPDPLRIELGGRATLLSHGDRYCSDDRAYQRWRRISRNRFGLAIFGLLSRQRRRKIAASLRARSNSDKRNKAEAIMDVNAQAIAAAMREHQVTRLIHGHTHRPADHRVHLGTQRGERLVLADWHPQRMEYLLIDERGVAQRRLLEG
ncbi:UDP-2,3-diacylglucosamine hydrolase [Solimonas aquatica]|uniref:UDP-2,3-diacylglucosamine hydrolase n=1 Tax=Solimonas aquatica TaxID=489703 RepID=A0A1H8ZLB8_9GAMM|nr:UDP-2,3-diacylglucosamine diphosphatase [Solimonas aquatica]SEP65164.1 UDP-2,3-diacylglucosamine hydrolase [Solimonas aquatica]